MKAQRFYGDADGPDPVRDDLGIQGRGRGVLRRVGRHREWSRHFPFMTGGFVLAQPGRRALLSHWQWAPREVGNGALPIPKREEPPTPRPAALIHPYHRLAVVAVVVVRARVAALSGAVAQQSEQRPYKPQADGAIPSRPTTSRFRRLSRR